MIYINRILSKNDYIFVYNSSVNTFTNLIDLFHKHVISPLMDKIKNGLSSCYTHLNKKSLFRCSLLVKRVIGNLFANKNQPTVNHEINAWRVSLNDVKKILIPGMCLQSNPCQHGFTVLLKDGRKVSCWLDGIEICSLIFSIPSEKINPGQGWDSERVKSHFCKYLKFAQRKEPPEIVLNKLFYKDVPQLTPQLAQ